MNNLIFPCHSEPFASLEDKLSEGSQSLRCYRGGAVYYNPSTLRFFAPLRSAQNDNKADLALCHPEHSEGSRPKRYYSNVQVYFIPMAFRFFAPLRFAQNDNGCGVPFTVFEDKLCERSATLCHPEPFASLEDKLSEGSQCQRYCLNMLIFFIPVIAQIGPLGISCFYQLDLLPSQPALNGFFSVYGRGDVGECFVIDKLVDIVLISKALNEFLFMLMHSANDIVGQADVECAGPVGHDIHEVLVVSTHELNCNVKSYFMSDFFWVFVRRLDSSLHFVPLRMTTKQTLHFVILSTAKDLDPSGIIVTYRFILHLWCLDSSLHFVRLRMTSGGFPLGMTSESNVLRMINRGVPFRRCPEQSEVMRGLYQDKLKTLGG